MQSRILAKLLLSAHRNLEQALHTTSSRGSQTPTSQQTGQNLSHSNQGVPDPKWGDARARPFSPHSGQIKPRNSARVSVGGQLSTADLEVKKSIDGEYTASPLLNTSQRDRLYGYAHRVAESSRKKEARRVVWEVWRGRTVRQKKLVKGCENFSQVCMRVLTCLCVLQNICHISCVCIYIHTYVNTKTNMHNAPDA
jgi:hypothetical protein